MEDTTAPEFTFVPADYTVECSDDLLLEEATAMDNCNGAVLEVTSEVIPGNATGNYTVVRTFTATDDAGNMASATQTITVEDTTAPEFTSVPADYTAECSDDLVLENATASDNCNGAVISVESETIEGDAAGNYTCRTHVHCDRRCGQQQQRHPNHHGSRHHRSRTHSSCGLHRRVHR